MLKITLLIQSRICISFLIWNIDKTSVFTKIEISSDKSINIFFSCSNLLIEFCILSLNTIKGFLMLLKHSFLRFVSVIIFHILSHLLITGLPLLDFFLIILPDLKLKMLCLDSALHKKYLSTSGRISCNV